MVGGKRGVRLCGDAGDAKDEFVMGPVRGAYEGIGK